jgi:uncharacterized protein (DUF2147 family)
MNRASIAARCLAGLGLLALARGATPAPADLRGIWVNPDRTVSVRVAPCGYLICGVVIRADATAIDDARDGGYAQLIGLQIMTGYRPAGPGRWIGRVLVPDLGHVFSSHIDLIDPDHARVAGCLIGQHLCQSQVWQRA